MTRSENDRTTPGTTGTRQDQPTGKGGERDAQSPGGIHSDTSNESQPKMYPDTEEETTGPTPGPGTQGEKSLRREGSEDAQTDERGNDTSRTDMSEESLRQRQAQRKDNPPAL
jgi:hypothetical protein